MPLKLFVSNSLSALSGHLCKSLKSNNRPVFQPVTIVTQTEGMSNWLMLEIAKNNGIAAHIQYKKPGEIIQQIFRIMGGSSGTVLARQHMDWLIYTVLDSPEFQRIFKDKASYYNEDAGTASMKRMALARRLADLFDQYQIYRSSTIRQWSEKDWEEENPRFQWQAYIWQAVKQLAGHAVPDMTNLSAFILEALRNPEQVSRLQQALPEINLFGLSIITQYHVQIFHELAKHINLHFYLLNPAPDIYWIEDRSEKELIKLKAKKHHDPNLLSLEGNPLLTNWGKVLQHTFGMLYQTESFINQQEEVDVAEPEQKSLLQKIQYDIFHNRTEDIFFNPEDLSDESIVIQNNYSRLREVESLYNYLADILHHRKVEGLNAKDILVMVSNVEEYAPYIRGVFSNAPVPLPFHIADESVAQGNTPLSCLIALLNLNEQNFTAENVLQLLEFESIRNHFAIYDMHHIRDCVQMANIRFGTKNDVQDDSYTVSWNNGLHRMMYGLCLSDEAPYAIPGMPSFYCLDITEGAEKMQQVVRFSFLITSLMKMIHERKRERNMSAWIQYTVELMEKFIDFEEDDEQYARIIDRQIKQYESVSELLPSELDFDVYSKHICDHLQLEQQTKVFTGSGITFCSQIPMRSIPFKVIAMLGLGIKDFPRKEMTVDFDLIRDKPRLGDRNIKNNDRHLFLETILSAESKLYLSYVGRSVMDNSHLPPSVLVDELLDYIQQGINRYTRSHNLSRIDIREEMVLQQPLHSFSARYNKPGSRLVNYLLRNPDMDVWEQSKGSASPVQLSLESVSVKDLVMFCTNPIKFYYQKVLRIYLNEEDLIIPETEIFELDALDKALLQKNLMHAQLNSESMEQTRMRMLKQGRLPLKNMSVVTAQEQEEIVLAMYQQLAHTLHDPKEQIVNIELALPDLMIMGSLDSVFNDHYVYFNFTGKEKNLIEAYVKYLTGMASGLKGARVITKSEGMVAVHCSKEQALKRLEHIAGLMQQGLNQMIIFGKEILIKEKNAALLNDEALQNFIKNAIESSHPTCYDNYIIDAFYHGAMNQPGISENYLELYNYLYLAAIETFIQN